MFQSPGIGHVPERRQSIRVGVAQSLPEDDVNCDAHQVIGSDHSTTRQARDYAEYNRTLATALNQTAIPKSVNAVSRQQVLEYDAPLHTGSALAHDRTTSPGRGGERRARFTAGIPSGRQVHVIDQPCI
jgi:hypothetical protein